MERYRPSLAWNTEERDWYKYSTNPEGIWGREPEEFVGQLVKSELEVGLMLEKLRDRQTELTKVPKNH